MGKKTKRQAYKPFKIADESFGLRGDDSAPLYENSTFGERIVCGYLNEEDKLEGSPCRKMYPYLEYIIWEFISRVREASAQELADYLRSRGEANEKIRPGVEAVCQNVKALRDCILEFSFLQVQKLDNNQFKIYMA